MKLKKVVEFEIDDKIAESIIKLNNKGYETAMCCSGHPDEEEIIPYVMFNKFVSHVIEYIPFGWVTDERFKELVIRRYFTSEEKESPDIIYDCIKSSGLLDVVIDNIPEEEYNELFSYLTTMVEEKKELSKTLSGAISKLINELPEKAQEAKNIIDTFDQEKFENVVNFAAAANGNRPIEE